MRLINANELMKKIVLISHNSHVETLKPDALKMADEILDLISEEHVIDAEPVRHGKWITYFNGYAFECRCSECKNRIPAIIVKTTNSENLCCEVEEVNRTDYCPNCGAKMDEEAKTDES